MAVLMLAENVISPDAVKMGDVITTLAGKTVEVYNTDAEGRLVLCDGITFAQRMGAAHRDRPCHSDVFGTECPGRSGGCAVWQ